MDGSVFGDNDFSLNARRFADRVQSHRTERKEEVEENIKGLKNTCKLLPPGPLKVACQAAIAAEEQALKELCDQCADP